MFCDLNVQWTTDTAELSRTLAFLSELGYNVVALNVTITGKFPTDLKCRIPNPVPFAAPSNLTILRRCTLQVAEPVSNARLNALAANYDILALRPTDEKAFQNTCGNLDCDLVSLDLTQRLGFFFKFKTVSECIKRGVRLEIDYAQALLGDADAKRNLIANAVQLIRATRGRGIVIASDARRALGCRGPWDVVNLAAIWGLPQDRAYEAVSKAARSVVATAKLKRTSFRGVVDVVYGGQQPIKSDTLGAGQTKKNADGNGARLATNTANGPSKAKKRKIDEVEPEKEAEATAGDKPISKREQKRREKAARQLRAAQEEQNTTAAAAAVAVAAPMVQQ